jgi:phospho-2-dehydro-3-deoxyheptonate aldolase
MRHAPEAPSNLDLKTKHPTVNARQMVAEKRQSISAIIRNPGKGLIVIAGPCALTTHEETIKDEDNKLNALEQTLPGLIVAHRLPAWKPRSNPEEPNWGLETLSPEHAETAYRILASTARLHAQVAMEFGYSKQVDRYAHLTSFSWVGARAVKPEFHDSDLMKELALHDPQLPIGIKNGLDGTIRSALRRVEEVAMLRGKSDAPAVLIYRGGENAQTPTSWEENYIVAWKATKGRLIVDTAHGGEQSHDPSGNYKKSVEGQIACAKHLIKLMNDGFVPAGVIMEASDAESTVDPNMPFSSAIDLIREMTSTIRNGQSANLAVNVSQTTRRL